MKTEQIEQLAKEHFTEYLGTLFTDQSEYIQNKMIFAFTQGYLKGEIDQINARAERAMKILNEELS